MSLAILGVVPARRGSKGVPGKNVRPLAGRSPIERAYDVAAASRVLRRIILSTDDPDALALARRVGLDVPFARPPALARDDTPMIDVVLHALAELEARGERFDAVLLLQPTSPLRTPEHLRRAVGLLEASPEASAVCSVTPVPPERCPHYLMKVSERGFLQPFMPDGARYRRRQDVPRAHQRCGTVFLTRTGVLETERSFYGPTCLPMQLAPDEAINIDGPEDWAAAERRLEAAERKSA